MFIHLIFIDRQKGWIIHQGDILAIVPAGRDLPENLDDKFWFGMFQGAGNIRVGKKKQVHILLLLCRRRSYTHGLSRSMYLLCGSIPQRMQLRC